MNKMELNTIAGLVSALIGVLLGEISSSMLVLFILMGMDVLTGIVDAVVFGKSKYSNKVSSDALYKGAFRKGMEICLIVFATQLDKVLSSTYCATAVIYYLIATEGISIIENMGRAGVPIPKFLRDILDVMQDEYDNGGKKE